MSDIYETNSRYWANYYDADNVESFIFRFYGRILKHDFKIDGSQGEKLFDFGCGQGGALNFFHKKGFKVYGVDISKNDIRRAKEKFSSCLAQGNANFEEISPVPEINQNYFNGLNLGQEWIDVAISIQTLDFLTRQDCVTVTRNIYNRMKPGGVFFASVNGTKHYYFKHSREIPGGDGLRHVKFKNDRISCDFYNVFYNSEQEVIDTFSVFKPLYVDWYDSSFRNEGSEFRWTFCGVKE